MVFGSIAIEITGSGNTMRSSMIGVLFVAERVAGGGRLQTDAPRDVAGLDVFDLFALVGVHLQQAPDALALALGRCSARRCRCESARVHAQERQLTDERDRSGS